jgi:hypothetical protein
MSFRFDATLKDLLTPAPEEYVSAFGLAQIQPAVALNVDLSTISAATDVAIGFGAPIQEIVDLNFQSGPDPDVPARCLLYSAALKFRFGVPSENDPGPAAAEGGRRRNQRETGLHKRRERCRISI